MESTLLNILKQELSVFNDESKDATFSVAVKTENGATFTEYVRSAFRHFQKYFRKYFQKRIILLDSIIKLNNFFNVIRNFKIIQRVIFILFNIFNYFSMGHSSTKTLNTA